MAPSDRALAGRGGGRLTEVALAATAQLGASWARALTRGSTDSFVFWELDSMEPLQYEMTSRALLKGGTNQHHKKIMLGESRGSGWKLMHGQGRRRRMVDWQVRNRVCLRAMFCPERCLKR